MTARGWKCGYCAREVVTLAEGREMLAVEHRAVASLNPQSQWHPDQQAGTCETLSFLSTHLTTSSCKCPSPLNCSYRMDRAQALQQNIDYYQQQQAQLLADINRCLSEATHVSEGSHPRPFWMPRQQFVRLTHHLLVVVLLHTPGPPATHAHRCISFRDTGSDPDAGPALTRTQLWWVQRRAGTTLWSAVCC